VHSNKDIMAGRLSLGANVVDVVLQKAVVVLGHVDMSGAFLGRFTYGGPPSLSTMTSLCRHSAIMVFVTAPGLYHDWHRSIVTTADMTNLRSLHFR